MENDKYNQTIRPVAYILIFLAIFVFSTSPDLSETGLAILLLLLPLGIGLYFIKSAKAFFNLLTVIWFLAGALMFYNLDTVMNDIYKTENDIPLLIIGVSVWIWLGVRWIGKRIKGARQSNVPNRENNISLLRIFLVNIVAPIIVSLVVWTFTGEPTITIASVPIVGFVSLALNIG